MPLTAQQQIRLNELEEKERRYKQKRLLELEDKEKSVALKTVTDTLKNWWAGTIEPIKDYKQTYKQEYLSGRNLVSKGISKEKQSVWQRAKNIGIGTLQYVMSPLTALAETAGEELVEEPLKGLGVPDPVAEFSGRLGEEAVYFIPIGSTIRMGMMAGKPGLRAATELEQVTKELARTSKKTIKQGPKTFQQQAAQEAIEAIKIPKDIVAQPSKVVRPAMANAQVDNITRQAVNAFKKADELGDDRIFQQVAEKMALGEIHLPSLKEIARTRGWSDIEIAKVFKDSISFGARNMAYLSRLRKQLDDVFKDSPGVVRAIGEQFGKDDITLIDKSFDMIGRAANVWRASLVSQMATSMRNAWSQIGRLSISAFDEALQSAISKSVGGEGKLVTSQIGRATINETRRDINKLMSVLRIMKPKTQDTLFKVLNSEQGIVHKARLFSTSVHEVGLGNRYSRLVNSLNRTQEFFFRRIAFEAKLRQQLKKKGLNFNTIDPKNIPENVLEESVNYALEMTFAASPKSKAVQSFVKSWTKSPLVLINPFPRFNFANAIPFMFEHSPLGYLNAIKPSTIKKLASGNTDEFAKAASRATIGSLMLDSAMRIRQSKYAGEKWYEIKTSEDPKSGKSVNWSTLAYAPLSTHLFVAEALVNPQNLKTEDYGKLAIGLNRIAGSGLVFVDWLRATTPEGLQKQLSNFWGQHIGSWFTPARTIKDFYSGIDPDEAIYRDWRESPILASIMSNLPKISQMVPEKPSSLKTEKQKTEDVKIGDMTISGGIYRQLTGLTKKTKTLVEREVDRVRLPWINTVPKTGIPRADRGISREMAPIVEKLLPAIINRKQYQGLTPEGQRLVLKQIFAEIKSQAKRQWALKNPQLAMQVAINSQDRDIQQIISRSN